MIEVADSNATYYYHFDVLGSVVALSDSSGDTVQTYEYSIYGEVAVEDANHTNPYMFAGRRYDIEIGLYYNRARYYNPYMGRFLQTDPIGYGDGMNSYIYCGNNPLLLNDPTGTSGVYLVPGLEYVIDDVNIYYEWTGEWRVTNWRGGGRYGYAIFKGSMKRHGTILKAVLKICDVADTSVDYAKLVFDKNPATAFGIISSAMLNLYLKQISEINAAILNRVRTNVEDGYRAWIRVRAYKERTGLSRILGKWDGFWPEGSDRGWIEVNGGDGFDETGNLPVYSDPEYAFSAIHEAVSTYMNPRPGGL